nr:protein FAM135B-like [Ipomoea batatas]
MHFLNGIIGTTSLSFSVVCGHECNYGNEGIPSEIIPYYVCCNFTYCLYPEQPIQTATKRAELHRQSISQMKITSCAIQDMQIFGDPLRTPIVIVERVRIAPFLSSHQDHNTDIKLAGIGSKPIKKFDSLRRNSRVLKVVVFVHGFQGHHLDLRLVRNQWLLIEPKIHFLMSESNEEKTSGDFREMGLNLAQEVTSYIKKRMDKVTRSGNLESIKLSFVGHSLGNVIIRAALTGLFHIILDVSLQSTPNITNSFCYFYREHYGTISQISVYICFCFWPTSWLSVQFEFFVQFWVVGFEEAQRHTVYPSAYLFR